jgi:hypothetical protein
LADPKPAAGFNDGESYHESNSIDQKALRELQDCTAQRRFVRYLCKSKAQTATGIDSTSANGVT